MGHKVNPFNYRLGYIYSWRSRWFAGKSLKEFLSQDEASRNLIAAKFKDAAVTKVEISRSANDITFDIHTSRPGVIIGRGGMGIEEIKKVLAKKLPAKTSVKVNIKEVNEPSKSAALLAQGVAEQLEKRIPFRRAIKQIVEKAREAGVLGVRVNVAGRLDGADMSRRETVSWGEIPLQTLRADIDYNQLDAHTPVGLVGVKVWVYRGEKFGIDEEEKKEVAEKPGFVMKRRPVRSKK